MKLTLQIALGICIAGVVLFVGKLLFWGMLLSALSGDLKKTTHSAASQLNSQQQLGSMKSQSEYRTVTEVIKPKSIRECQAIYGQEVNEIVRSCMEGSVLTVRINSKTGGQEILKHEKYYHLEKRNVL